MDSTLRMFWDLESLGISNDDSTVMEEFDREITFKDGRYLPWKESHDALPDNYHLSKKRLLSLLGPTVGTVICIASTDDKCFTSSRH